MKKEEYINRLNELCAAERRMNILYRIAAQSLTGPWRDALAAQFEEHANHENKHSDIVMRHIIALGGKIDNKVADMPKWANLSATLSGIEDLEAQGIKSWQELLNKLDNDDPFKALVEDIIGQEQHHHDESKRWIIENHKDENITNNSQQLIEDLPPDLVVGDNRRLSVQRLSTEYMPVDEEIIGQAWQDENGVIHGTGICEMMLFEPMSKNMYHNASIGTDRSPLSVFALRVCMSSFVTIKWEADEGIW